MQRVALEKLTVSKKLTRAAADYSSKQAHVECVAKMRRRDPQAAPVLGDRVPYVIVAGAGPMSGRAESPAYVTEHGIPLDTTYYIEKQLCGPITRIFEPIIGAAATRGIFIGDHTRRIVKRLPKSGGLMDFFQVQKKAGPPVPAPVPTRPSSRTKIIKRPRTLDDFFAPRKRTGNA